MNRRWSYGKSPNYINDDISGKTLRYDEINILGQTAPEQGGAMACRPWCRQKCLGWNAKPPLI